MKKILFTAIFFVCVIGYTQQKGLIIEDYGKVYKIDQPDLQFEKGKTYKVVFDVYTDSPDIDKANPLLKTVVRYLQIHTQNGIPKENLKVAVVLHGTATKNVLTNAAYTEQYSVNNPNAQIISALSEEGVELFVCGQSFAGKGFEKKHKMSEVKMALSALTALVWFQTGGYQTINFN